jgi:alpha-galactosidase
VIRDYGADEIMWDYNSRPGVGGQRRVGDYVEDTAWRYYENLYGLLSRLAEKYPHVTWLNCASGGARNDLGILQRYARATVVTDYSVMPRAIKMINGLTMALPPEVLCYFTNHIEASTRWTDWQTQMRVSLMCGSSFLGLHPVLEYGMKALWAQTARYVDLFHTFTSRTIRGCRVYHHTPDCPVDRPGSWCVLEYVGEAGASAYAGIFRLEAADRDEYVFRARGLDPEAAYEVTFDSSEAKIVRSGQALREDGLRLRLPAPLMSELLLFRRVAH